MIKAGYEIQNIPAAAESRHKFDAKKSVKQETGKGRFARSPLMQIQGVTYLKADVNF